MLKKHLTRSTTYDEKPPEKGNKWNLPKYYKNSIHKPTANVILNGEKLKAFLLRLETRGMSTITTIIHHSPGSPNCSS